MQKPWRFSGWDGSCNVYKTRVPILATKRADGAIAQAERISDAKLIAFQQEMEPDHWQRKKCLISLPTSNFVP